MNKLHHNIYAAGFNPMLWKDCLNPLGVKHKSSLVMLKEMLLFKGAKYKTCGVSCDRKYMLVCLLQPIIPKLEAV